MKKTELKTKSLKMTLKSLAFALGLVATANTTSMAMPIQQQTKVESHSHDEHDHELEIENVVVKVETNNSNNTQKVYKLISIKEVPNYSISSYKGSSIVEALNKCGIDASFKNRKLMATNLGIVNYKGTADQNITLLNTLKAMNIESYAKVSNVTMICQKLFGLNAKNVIADLELPTTKNLTKSDFARIIRKIANHMNVDTTTYDNKLGLVLDRMKDVNLQNKNNNDIAWSYYMGYTDIDENSNFNGNNFVTVNELNAWSQSFVKDYNLAVTNNTVNGNGLVITPSQDIYNRDKGDFSKINDIRNPKIQTPTVVSPSDNNDDRDKDDDDKEEKHVHKYGKWKYYDEENESSTCKDCGKVKYRKHKLNATTEKSYESNEDETHKVTETTHCGGCNTNIIKEHNEDCEMGEWVYNKIANLEIRDCDLCGYELTRPHEHTKAPSNLVYTLDRTYGNGTHKLKAVYDCNICNAPVTLYKDEACNMGPWLYNSETQKEERECTVCDYEETKEHEHVQAPSNLVYTLDRSYNNGTHKLKAVYDCNICNTPITLYKDENCNMSEWTYNSETQKEERECTVCDYEEAKEHEHVQAPSNLVYTLDRTNGNGTHKLKAVYDCNICNTPITLYKDENCNMSEWTYNSETQKEERECTVCDYEEAKEHEHVQAPSNLVYTLDRTNGNGTHKLKAVYDCNICNTPITLYKDENCNMSEWTYNSETQKEERECTVCDYEEAKEHEHVQAPSNLVYTLDRTNGNGTHKLKAVYDCNICNTPITLYKDENCQYSEWQKNDGFTCKKECEICDHEVTKNHDFDTVENSVTSNPTIGKHNVLEKCNDCGTEKQVEVSCTGDGNIYYHVDGDIVTERENCAICNDICKDDPHTHQHGEFTPVDDDNHKRICDCGNESVSAHNYGSWEVTNEGTNERECSECGHTQTVTHTCSLSSHNEYPSTKVAEYCYERVTECEIDGCEVEERTKIGHDYYVDSNAFGAVYTCDVCQYSYEELYEPTQFSLRQSQDEEEIEETQEPTLDPKELDIYKKEEKEEELDDVQKTEPEKEPEPEFEQLDIYKEEDEELEEEQNKVLVLK